MLPMRSLLPPLLFTIAYAAISLGVTNSYYQLILTLVPVWAVFGLSWNLLSGYTGLISFGHAAFFGIGAYTTALGQIYFDLSPWLLIPVAAMLGGMGSIEGALLGGFCVGVVQSVSAYYVAPAFGQLFFFLLFLLVTIFRPNGLLGQKGAATLGMNE